MRFRRDRPAAHRRLLVMPWTPLGRALALLGLAAAIGAAVLAGYLWAASQSESASDDLEYLENRIKALEIELEDADRRLADVNLAREIDRQAVAIQSDEMAKLQDTVGELRENLAFYRQLMNTPAQGEALDVADFEVIGREGAGPYRYRLLLTRPTEQGDWVSGTARLDVTGVRGGSELRLALPEISDTDSYPLDYRFRYFQRLSGSLTLPNGFRPLRVTVKLSPRGEESSRVERTFEWPETTEQALRPARNGLLGVP